MLPGEAILGAHNEHYQSVLAYLCGACLRKDKQQTC